MEIRCQGLHFKGSVSGISRATRIAFSLHLGGETHATATAQMQDFWSARAGRKMFHEERTQSLEIAEPFVRVQGAVIVRLLFGSVPRIPVFWMCELDELFFFGHLEMSLNGNPGQGKLHGDLRSPFRDPSWRRSSHWKSRAVLSVTRTHGRSVGWAMVGNWSLKCYSNGFLARIESSEQVVCQIYLK